MQVCCVLQIQSTEPSTISEPFEIGLRRIFLFRARAKAHFLALQLLMSVPERMFFLLVHTQFSHARLPFSSFHVPGTRCILQSTTRYHSARLHCSKQLLHVKGSTSIKLNVRLLQYYTKLCEFCSFQADFLASASLPGASYERAGTYWNGFEQRKRHVS